MIEEETSNWKSFCDFKIPTLCQDFSSQEYDRDLWSKPTRKFAPMFSEIFHLLGIACHDMITHLSTDAELNMDGGIQVL